MDAAVPKLKEERSSNRRLTKEGGKAAMAGHFAWIVGEKYINLLALMTRNSCRS
jgi:hypothetical protein